MQENIKKPRLVACLYCNKSHKKCDGNRPCSNCVSNKIECSENNQRKAIGRPKKRNLESYIQQPTTPTNNHLQSIPQSINKQGISFNTVTSLSFGQGNPTYMVTQNENNLNPFNFIEVKENQMCPLCNSLQLDDAKFCSQCGHNLRTRTTNVEDMKLQIETLQKRNEYLVNSIKMKESTSSQDYYGPQMWALFKFKSGEFRKQIPPPVYILKTSQSFQKLLGYDSLLNKYLPDLVPKEFHKIFESEFNASKNNKCVEFPENALPKLNCNSRITYQHFDGHYIDAQVNTDIYFDPISKEPTFGMIVVENVWPHTPIPVEESSKECPFAKMKMEAEEKKPEIKMEYKTSVIMETNSDNNDSSLPIDSTFEFEFLSSDSPIDSNSHDVAPSPPLNFFSEFDNMDILNSNNNISSYLNSANFNKDLVSSNVNLSSQINPDPFAPDPFTFSGLDYDL